MNVSWYREKGVCAANNASLLSITSHNDVITIQGLLEDFWKNTFPVPLFLNLKLPSEVSEEIVKICSVLKKSHQLILLLPLIL